jgi:hypothetical protein
MPTRDCRAERMRRFLQKRNADENMGLKIMNGD